MKVLISKYQGIQPTGIPMRICKGNLCIYTVKIGCGFH